MKDDSYKPVCPSEKTAVTQGGASCTQLYSHCLLQVLTQEKDQTPRYVVISTKPFHPSFSRVVKFPILNLKVPGGNFIA